MFYKLITASSFGCSYYFRKKKKQGVFLNPITMLSIKCPLPLLGLLTLAEIILILKFFEIIFLKCMWKLLVRDFFQADLICI